MKKIIAIVLSAVMMLSLLPVAFASDTHDCGDAKDCVVCYLAELINSLPEAKEISAENAAEVTDTIHAIDCVKFDLTDAEYDELLTLVVSAENSNGGLPVPKAYMDALNAIVNLDDGCSFHISKDVIVEGIDSYDLSESYVAFEITGTDGYCATVTLRDAVQGAFTLDESQAESADFFTATLASFDGYYSMDEQGWTYSYRLPAGTYTVKEVTDSMIINGTEYTGFDVSCNGKTANDGYTFILTDGSKSVVHFSNSYGPRTLSFNANGGEGWMDTQEIGTNGRVEIPENKFVKPGYIFTGWNTLPDGSDLSYLPGDQACFYENTVLFAQWQECTEHSWNEGACSKCDKKCAHTELKSEITARPESTDGIIWSKGEKTYTCECGYKYTQEVDRANYSEYIKASLEFAELILTEDLTVAAKAEIMADYEALGELQQNLIVDEQKIVDDYTNKLNALIEKIKAGIDDGSYLKADYTELENAIEELEKVLAENEDLITKDAKDALEKAIEDANATDRDLTKSEDDTEILNAAVEAAKDAASLDDGDFKVDTSEAEKLIAELEEKGTEDEAVKAEIESIKAEIEKIKADENASKAEFDEIVKGYIERLQEIKNASDKEDEFRCGMCDVYEENMDTPVIGFFYKIIHLFVHFAQLISFKS